MVVGVGEDLDLYFEHVEIFALVFSEVVEEFSLEGELFMGRGEDGVLGEVDLGKVGLTLFLSSLRHSAEWRRVKLRGPPFSFALSFIWLRWVFKQSYSNRSNRQMSAQL